MTTEKQSRIAHSWYLMKAKSHAATQGIFNRVTAEEVGISCRYPAKRGAGRGGGRREAEICWKFRITIKIWDWEVQTLRAAGSMWMGRSQGPSMSGWNSATQAEYFGASSNFMFSTNSVNLRNAGGWWAQSCSADEIILRLQTWKPLLSPCTMFARLKGLA